MKPQTFEEWVNETHGLNMSYLIVSNQVDKLRDCWQAAMENAAKTCEWCADGFREDGEADCATVAGVCADAIREAAKGDK